MKYNFEEQRNIWVIDMNIFHATPANSYIFNITIILAGTLFHLSFFQYYEYVLSQ